MHLKTKIFITLSFVLAAPATQTRTTLVEAATKTLQHQTARVLTAIVHTLLNPEAKQTLVAQVREQQINEIQQQVDSLHTAITASQKDADHLNAELKRTLQKNQETTA